jgi:ATP-dependent Clp protease ATP-binding subunit ClpC
MFDRFTERALRVVVLAQAEARTLGQDHIGTEHVLLGLVLEGEGLGARVLESLDLTADHVRAHVVRIDGGGAEDAARVEEIPFSPRAKKVLELALREALSLGHSYIGTEHILLGVAREKDGAAARILLDVGADAERIRSEVIRMLPEPRPVPARAPAPTRRSPRVTAHRQRPARRPAPGSRGISPRPRSCSISSGGT